MSLVDDCKDLLNEYMELIDAKDWNGVRAKLTEDTNRRPEDFLKTVNLQKTALIITKGLKDHPEIKEERAKLWETFNEVMDNRSGEFRR